jgi:hypothetical protein
MALVRARFTGDINGDTNGGTNANAENFAVSSMPFPGSMAATAPAPRAKRSRPRFEPRLSANYSLAAFLTLARARIAAAFRSSVIGRASRWIGPHAERPGPTTNTGASPDLHRLPRIAIQDPLPNDLQDGRGLVCKKRGEAFGALG